MAITIISQPTSPNIIGNTTEIVVSSTNIAQPNFKFVFDVYVGSQIARVKRTPAPNGRGYFDLSRIGWDEIDNDGDNLISLALPGYAMTTGTATFQVQIGEEYGTPPSIFANLSAANNIYSVKGDLDYLDYANYDPLDYFVDNVGSPANKFLTRMPREVRIGDTQPQFLTFFRDAIQAGLMADDVKIITYDSSGAEIDQYTINLNVLSPSDKAFVRAGIGPEQLNSYTSPTYLIEGSQPIITEDVYKYGVYVMLNTQDDILTEVFTFIIDRRCYKESRTFLFKNSFGVYESVQFNGNREKINNYNRTLFGRPRALGESAQTYRRFERNIFIDRKPTFNVTSGYITEDEAEWMRDLYESYDVFVVDNGEQIAVNIIDASYTELTRNNTRLINIELNYQYTY